MKDVLIVANFCDGPYENTNNRFNYIAELLSDESNIKVELITSDFCHRSKLRRKKVDTNQLKYKITMLHEPQYNKNVSLRRFYAHYIFSRNIKNYLNKRKKPDVIYCAVPSLDVAKVTVGYAKKNNIKIIIDIQDLWPEAFQMVFNVPIVSEFVFKPMYKQANYIYKSADSIVAVSDTYRKRALKVRGDKKSGDYIYLGTDLRKFGKFETVNKPNNEFWIIYIGTLGHSYSIDLIIDSLELLKEELNNIKFIVVGDGPLKSKFEYHAKIKGVNCKFIGRKSYEEMVGYLFASDLAVNPITKGAAGSIINKVGDYAAAGLAVISTQECEEYREIINNYKIGFNCDYSVDDISEKIKFLYLNEDVREEMGINNRKLAELKFDRNKTYKKIIDLILGEMI